MSNEQCAMSNWRERSRLDELIKELSPDLPAGRQVGVEYKHFNEVAQYVRGVTYGKGQEVNDGGDVSAVF